MGVPPLALTRLRPVWVWGENTITPPGPQAPPRPKGASAMVWVEPPSMSMVFSLPSAKNTRDGLAGDQKGKIALSVPDNWCASVEFIGRTQSVILPSALAAANATNAPSGDNTGGPAPSPVRVRVAFSGGLITVRMARAD